VRLEVGDTVVYRAHGAGRVAAREQRVILGVERETVVLDLADGLSVALTLEQAQAQLRPVIDEAGMQGVQERLRDEAESGSDIWHKRRKATQAKLTGGDPLQVAEIVRDGESRRQRTNPGGEPKMLSLAEKNQYVKARQLLAGEIAVARGLDLIEADAWIDIQLAAGTS
jgi:CarD family transcriptional regulator, regulator of rRNA transcription